MLFRISPTDDAVKFNFRKSVKQPAAFERSLGYPAEKVKICLTVPYIFFTGAMKSKELDVMNVNTVFLSLFLSLVFGCAPAINNSPDLQKGIVLSRPERSLKVQPEKKTAVKTPSKNSAAVKTVAANSVTKPAVSEKKTVSDNKGFSAVLNEAAELCEASQKLWQNGETDKALKSLDRAYSLILSVESDDNAELIQQKEDLRLTISKRILEIYASRNTAAVGTHNAIPLIMNEYVQTEIETLTEGKCKEESFFIRAYKRSGKYRPLILEELKKAGLPEELSWLPLIESGFRVYALSNARALGLWQFIQSTGYRFGLKRDKYVDERLDPEKATKAAVAYLKELHQIFGDWTTVLAAYNCGEGRVLSTIREQNVNYLDNFWDLYEKLPEETARFVPRFMATLHIIKDPKKYGLELGEAYSPPEYETVEISKQIHLKDVAELIDMPREKLRELNPELRYSIVPGGEYRLRVPPQTGDILLSRLDDTPEETSSEELSAASEEPQVQEADASVRDDAPIFDDAPVRDDAPAREFAPVRKSAPIRAAAPVRTKKAVKTVTLKSVKAVKKAAVSVSYHKVRRGETISSIARRYRISVNTVARMNGIGKRGHLAAGKSLKIPGGSVKTVSSSEEYGRTKYRPPVSKHIVRRGDSIYNIASRYNTTPDTLKGLNNIRKAKIRIGQVLKLPVKADIKSNNKAAKVYISSSKKAAKPDLRTYRVRRGDVLMDIARRHKMEFDRFLKVNHMTQRSKIYPGQKLYVD